MSLKISASKIRAFQYITLYFDLESAQVINAGQLEAPYIIQDQLSRLTKQNKNAK